jgi:hypothetical protein
VVLDIGEQRGALVVRVPGRLEGKEIEIRPEGSRWEGVHTAVRARHVGDLVVWAGVFGSLARGRYQLRVDGMALGAAEVRSGSVTVVDGPTD